MIAILLHSLISLFPLSHTSLRSPLLLRRGPTCGLSRKEVAAVVSRFPGILGISAERKIGPALEWIVAPIAEGGLGATPKQAAKMTLNSPQLYGLSLNETLKPRVEYLHSSVGIPWESMAGVLSKAPSLLTFPPRAIGKNLDYLQLELGMRPEIAARTVMRCPSILLASLPRKIRPIVAYLTDEVSCLPVPFPSCLWGLVESIRRCNFLLRGKGIRPSASLSCQIFVPLHFLQPPTHSA